MPENVLLTAEATGLPQDPAVDVNTLATLDRNAMAGHVPTALMRDVDRGFRYVREP